MSPHPSAAGIGATLAARIAALRTERDLTIQELADASGLAKSHVWELEQNRRSNPTVATVVALSRALGVSIDYLTGLSSDQPPLHPDALRIACDVDRLLRRSEVRALSDTKEA